MAIVRDFVTGDTIYESVEREANMTRQIKPNELVVFIRTESSQFKDWMGYVDADAFQHAAGNNHSVQVELGLPYTVHFMPNELSVRWGNLL